MTDAEFGVFVQVGAQVGVFVGVFVVQCGWAFRIANYYIGATS